MHGEDIPIPTPLCQYHYHLLYDSLHGTARWCVTRGMCLKHTSHRWCPQPQIVTKYLRDYTAFEGEIASSWQSVPNLLQISISNASRTPAWKHRQQLTPAAGHLLVMPLDQVTSKNVVQVAMAKTLCTVGEILLNRKAILLPSIQEHFQVVC